MSERWHVRLLLAVAILIYANTLVNNFTMDDELYVLRNPAVIHPTLHALFSANPITNVFRPVTFGSFAVEWFLIGAHPVWYHLQNLLLHAAVTWLLYLLLLKLLEGSAQAANVAFVAALLFAVHPIHTEAVASIVGRAELYAAGFLIAAWLLHLKDRPIGAAVCFVLALLSKEPAVVFLPLILISDYAIGKLKPISRYATVAGITAVYLGLLWKIQSGRFGPKDISIIDNPLAKLPADYRIANAIRIGWKYIGLHFYPGALSCDYSYNAVLLYAMRWQTLVPAIAAVILLGMWVRAVLKRKSGWALAGTIYFVGFAVTANILIPGGTIMGERLAYLSSAGFCLLIALCWVKLEGRQQKAAWAVLCVAVLALAGRTVARNRDWRDNFSLYSSAVQVVPRSVKMRTDLGAEYMYRGDLDSARRELQAALQIYPDFPEALEWMGLVEVRAGNDAEATALMKKALAATPHSNMNYDFVVTNLAAQLVKTGQYDEAAQLLNGEIASEPGNSRAWSNLAVIAYKRGDVNAARSNAENALRLDPSNGQAQGLLAVMAGGGSHSSEPSSGVPH